MVKITADSVDEFIDKAKEKFDGDLGDTTHQAAYKYDSFRDGKIVRLVFSCPITVSFAEVGMGKPDAANKKAILDVAATVKQHELKHKLSYENAFKDWNPKKVAKDLMDQDFDSQKDADKAIDEKLGDLISELLDACLTLHRKEGVVEVDHKKDGSIKLIKKAAGARGCA